MGAHLSYFKKVFFLAILILSAHASDKREKNFSIDDLEPHQILKIQFGPKSPTFSRVEVLDRLAKIWKEDEPVHLVSSSSYDHLTAPSGIIIYDQLIVPDSSRSIACMKAPKYIFNTGSFLSKKAKLVLKSSVSKSPCLRILITVKDPSRPAHLKGGVNFDPDSSLDKSQYQDLEAFFKHFTKKDLLYQPLSLYNLSSTLWLTNVKVKIVYKASASREKKDTRSK
jgi:hypothetical protein